MRLINFIDKRSQVRKNAEGGHKIRNRTALISIKVGSSPASDMVRLHTTWVGIAHCLLIGPIYYSKMKERIALDGWLSLK